VSTWRTAKAKRSCNGSKTSLRDTRLDLQGTIDELGTSNEELRVANEEVVSTTKSSSPRSRNWRPTKEELQSVNEELTTVNSQLQEKVERLDAANSDLANLLDVHADRHPLLGQRTLHPVLHAGVDAALEPDPRGRGPTITDLSMDFLDYDLTADARAVAREATGVEREVQRADGSPTWCASAVPHAEGGKVTAWS